MESKVMFDLDAYNLPILKLEINPTSDVRDKIAKRFVESLGHNSQWCVILSTSENEWQIWPIKPEEMRHLAQEMLQRANVYEDVPRPVK